MNKVNLTKLHSPSDAQLAQAIALSIQSSSAIENIKVKISAVIEQGEVKFTVEQK